MAGSKCRRFAFRLKRQRKVFRLPVVRHRTASHYYPPGKLDLFFLQSYSSLKISKQPACLRQQAGVLGCR